MKSTPVSPSMSMMVPAVAVSSCPATAVPVIAGSPIASLFAGRLRYTVRVTTGGDQSRVVDQVVVFCWLLLAVLKS